MKKRYISDLHLGHENCALKRGFKNAEEMDNYIIEKWNQTVKGNDITFILGDITMEKSTNYHLLTRLNGIKKVVLGNHDKPQHVPELLKHVRHAYGMITEKINGVKVALTHSPIHPFEIKESRFKYNIHGHTHLKIIEDKSYINVSAETLDYTPKTFEELIEINKERFSFKNKSCRFLKRIFVKLGLMCCIHENLYTSLYNKLLKSLCHILV